MVYKKNLKATPCPAGLTPLKLGFLAFLVSIFHTDSLHAQQSREAIIHTTLDQFHSGKYDSALANCARLKARDPDDLVGYVLEVGIYQGIMRYYRIRHYEAAFDSLIEHVIKLGKKRIRRGSPAEQQFLYGSALGYQALHRFVRGEWAAALKDAMQAKNTIENALRKDRNYADPWLMLGVYEHGKSRILSMGMGFFSGKRKAAIKMLERARKDGLYTSTDAALVLLGVYRDDKNSRKGLEVCNALLEKYPDHPSVLYNRAVFLQQMERFEEAVVDWRRLIQKLESFQHVSNAFLAECHLNLARIHEKTANSDASKSPKDQIRSELTLALAASEKFNPEFELSGSREKAEDVKSATEKMLNKYQ